MESSTNPLPENINPRQSSFWRRIYRWRYFIMLAVIATGLYYLGAIRHQIDILNPFAGGDNTHLLPIATPDPDYAMPDKDANRLNILILGIRGEDDPDASTGGPMLTDSIQVFSFDKTTKKSSLVSIPRDLFVTIHDNKKDKLNSAYEYGFYHSSNYLQFIKDELSKITGVYMDNVIVFDFSSFKEIIDALGGIDITLAAPFTESGQWGFSFSLPAGVNHLDGQTALYYARSRYSSSDFDRSRRQQQIIFAIKDKLLKLNFLGDPVKSFSILSLIKNDIKTDVGIWNLSEFLDLANQVKFDQIKKSVISTDNLVVESKENGAYILLPKGGTLAGIKQLFQDIIK